MASIIAGDTKSISFQHPTVGSREYSVQADQDIELKQEGYKNTMTPSGGSQNVTQLNRELGFVKGLKIVSSIETLEFLNALRNSPEDTVITWEHINGTTITGSGRITTDDITLNTNTGYITVDFTFSNGYKIS